MPVSRWTRPAILRATFALIGSLCGGFGAGQAAAVPLDKLELPDGFTVSVYAEGVTNARQIAGGGPGIVYVGSRREGVVHAVVDADGDHRAERVVQIASGLYMPSGVAYRDGTLFVAEVNRIIAFDNIDAQLAAPPQPRVVFDRLPNDAHHGWKFIAFGPDGKLYIPIGAPCNVCQRPEPYAAIWRLDVERGELEIVARGVRNSVGFDWHPVTGAFWFSDNGRDMLGDDIPPCEINRLTSVGEHFGFPYMHGDDIRDPEFGADAAIDDYTTPVIPLGAHTAPLGLLFHTGTGLPAAFRHNLFVAEHGSWNRSQKIGYRVMRGVIRADGSVERYEPFITGWLRGEAHWGRPVDFFELPDGSLLVSDDHAGVLYRIAYTSPDREP